MSYQTKSSKSKTGLPSYGSDMPTEAEMIKEMAGHFQQQNDELNTLKNDVVSLRRMAGSTGGFGKATAGGTDSELIGRFFKSIVGHKLGDSNLVEKAAANWEIQTDARGGYLVPPTVAAQIDASMRPFGSLLSAIVSTDVEPGRVHRVPAYSTAPTSAWQLNEHDALTELDIELSALERAPKACGGWLNISHQLFYTSAHNVGASITNEVLNANREAIETAVIAGQSGVDAPADGLLELAGAYDQAALATATPSLLSKFVSESLADNASLWERGTLILAPVVCEAIAQLEASSSNRGRLQVDERGGLRFGRWPLICSPAAGLNAIMADLQHVHHVGGGHTVLIDDRSGAKTLSVVMAVASWSNFGVSLPGSISRAAITNLA